MPFAIALKLEVPWDQANRRHKLILQLVTADGNTVQVTTEQGEQPIQLEGEFEVGRPPGIAPGTPIDMPLSISSGPIPLPPGSRYVWRLLINGEHDEDWELAFSTRPGQVRAIA